MVKRAVVFAVMAMTMTMLLSACVPNSSEVNEASDGYRKYAAILVGYHQKIEQQPVDSLERGSEEFLNKLEEAVPGSRAGNLHGKPLYHLACDEIAVARIYASEYRDLLAASLFEMNTPRWMSCGRVVVASRAGELSPLAKSHSGKPLAVSLAAHGREEEVSGFLSGPGRWEVIFGEFPEFVLEGLVAGDCGSARAINNLLDGRRRELVESKYPGLLDVAVARCGLK